MISFGQFLKEAMFESAHDIGDPVILQLNQTYLSAHVRTVTFTAGKVRYSLRMDIDQTTLHNIDSVLVSYNPSGVKMDMPFDNYS